MALSTNFPMTFILLSLTFLSQVSADCKTFTQSGDYYTETSATTEIVSRGYICNADSDYTSVIGHQCNMISQCPIEAYGTINAQGGTNITSLSVDQILPLYTLIPSQTKSKPTTFLYSLSSEVTNLTSCLDIPPPNSSVLSAGYYAFTANLLCIDGTLSSCSNGPVNDGTPIKVCGVDTYGSAENPGIDGTENFVTSDSDAVANMTSNPAATRSPVATLPSQEVVASTSGNAASTSTNAAVGGRVRAFDVLCVVLGTSLVL